jgi:hypothetical protein
MSIGADNDTATQTHAQEESLRNLESRLATQHNVDA